MGLICSLWISLGGKQNLRQRGWVAYNAHADSIDGDDVLNGGIALGLVQAVAAGLVEGAECVGVESRDVVLAAERIVLEDLQLELEGAVHLP